MKAQYTVDQWHKAKGIVKYVLAYSCADLEDRLNTLQVVTDGIKTGARWIDAKGHAEMTHDICQLAVKLFARYDHILNS